MSKKVEELKNEVMADVEKSCVNKELDREIKEEAENAKEFAKELKADIESRE